MKKNNDFQPIYLQDAKRHIDWIYEKIKNSSQDSREYAKREKPSIFSKFITFLKKVF